MALKANWVNNPEKYEELSKPFENRQEAEKAIKAFMRAVSKLREKHRIADVVLAIKGSYIDPNESTPKVGYMYHTQYGQALNGLPLAMYLEKIMRDQHNEIIDQLKA